MCESVQRIDSSSILLQDRLIFLLVLLFLKPLNLFFTDSTLGIIIEKMPTYRIAYLRKIGPYGINNIQTMEELKKWAKFNHLFNDESIILAIAQDNPETTKPENCRYDTCIVVSNDYSVTDGYVREGNIVGGKYAIFKINHTSEAVQKVYIDILKVTYRIGVRQPFTQKTALRQLLPL